MVSVALNYQLYNPLIEGQQIFQVQFVLNEAMLAGTKHTFIFYVPEHIPRRIYAQILLGTDIGL